ncbi:hypothetical protein PENSPDRAFT_91416 [Peniophora sp. CONT]|nr:hypothetical protein PENSPDRAFT_91416 [Peniophora sp. CONT]
MGEHLTLCRPRAPLRRNGRKTIRPSRSRGRTELPSMDVRSKAAATKTFSVHPSRRRLSLFPSTPSSELGGATER